MSHNLDFGTSALGQTPRHNPRHGRGPGPARSGHWRQRDLTGLPLNGDIDRRPSLALRDPCCPIHPRRPTCPRGRRGQGTSLNHRVGRRVRVLANQFQRNGVILDRRSVFGMATPVLSVGEERGGFTGIFEIVAADKARVDRLKRRPFARERRLPPYQPLRVKRRLLCAGNVDRRPYQPLRHPCCPIYPRIPA
jgi:hypothetical protein